MIKSTLIARIAQRLNHLPEQTIHQAVNTMVDQMCDALAQGNRIEIRDFGSFSLHYHPPRNAHNPKTGEKLVAEAKYVPHFKPGKELRERIIHAAKEGVPIKADLDEDEPE